VRAWLLQVPVRSLEPKILRRIVKDAMPKDYVERCTRTDRSGPKK